MKLSYYPETDSLYIDLSAKTGVDSNEVAPGVVLDFDADGQLVGIDINNAGKIVDLTPRTCLAASRRERPARMPSATCTKRFKCT